MMQSLLPSGVRARLLLLVLLAVVSSMALILVTASGEARLARLHAGEQAVLLSRLAAAREGRTLSTVRQLLHGLAHEDEVALGDTAVARRTLQRMRDPGAGVRAIALVSADGVVRASTAAGAAGTRVAGTHWFRTVRAHGHFVVADDGTGAHRGAALYCATPVRDAHHALIGYLGAELDTRGLGWAERDPRLPSVMSEMTWLLVDERGSVVFSGPGPGPRGDSTLAGFVPPGSEGGTTRVRGGDGVQREFVFTVVEDMPDRALYVGVGYPAARIVGLVARPFVRDLALMLLVGLVVMLLAWRGADALVLRRVEALSAATRRLRAGDLGARTGLSHGREELAELCRTFDDMAERLQADQHEFDRAAALLRASEARKSAVLEASLDGIFVFDGQGRILDCNAAGQRLVGCRGRCCGHHACEGSRLASLFFSAVTDLRDGQAPRVLESALPGPDGKEAFVEVTVAPIADATHPGLHVATVRDVTDNRRWVKTLEARSFLDDLTGLYNRRGFTVFARQQLRLAARDERHVVLVSVDLDDLKWINDRFGHAAGDRAIVEMAGVLRRCFRDTDVIGRLGGDEFVVLAPGTDSSGVSGAIERLFALLAERNASTQDPWPLSASVGWRLAEAGDGLRLAHLMAEADARMYAHKFGKRSDPGDAEPGRPEAGRPHRLPTRRRLSSAGPDGASRAA